MSENTTAIARVIPFRRAELLLVEHEGQPFVPMKPVVEGMGLAWQAQHRKLQTGRFESTITEMVIVAQDGKEREMTCLPLRKLAGWLMSIHPAKVRESIRESVIAYQNECDDALWAYWNDGIALRADDRSFETVLGTTIGTDGFHMLGALIKGKVTSLSGASKRRASGKIWSQLHAAFGVRSAQDIPAEQLDSARNFVAAYALEGEWLPSQQPEGQLLDINWPAQRWINETNLGTRDKMTFAQGKGNINIMASMLIEQGRVKPTQSVLKHLEQQGYNVEACQLELAALVHHLSDAHEMLANYRRMASWSEGRGIRFKMAQASA